MTRRMLSSSERKLSSNSMNISRIHDAASTSALPACAAAVSISVKLFASYAGLHFPQSTEAPHHIVAAPRTRQKDLAI